MSVTLTAGLPSYTEPPDKKLVNGITVEKQGTSPVSFILARVDSCDMVKSNVRVLNTFGQPDSFGRLEVRQGEIWKTVCNVMPDEMISKLACKAIG